MLLPTILDIPRGQAFGDSQPCPFCDAPTSVQCWLGVVYDDPRSPDDEHADHISHRVFVHGETSLVCFPVRRPGGAFKAEVSDWDAICAVLTSIHGMR
jgi:hypothetical protein